MLTGMYGNFHVSLVVCVVIGGLKEGCGCGERIAFSPEFQTIGLSDPFAGLGYSWQSQIWGELGPLFELDHHDSLRLLYTTTVQPGQTCFLRRLLLYNICNYNNQNQKVVAEIMVAITLQFDGD